MDTVKCMHCRQRSTVTPSTKLVRCHGCQRLLPVRNDVAKDAVPTYYQRSSIRNEAKMFYHGIKKRFSGSDHNNIQQNQNRNPNPNPYRGGKRALLCGVSYKKQKCELKGSAQDVKNMRDLLVGQFHFPIESILILSEEEPYMPPTRKNIEYAFQWLIKNIQSGDSMVFYFSGHGLRQRDLNGDEIDRFDEAICPVDFHTNGVILDDYINETIVQPLIQGVTLHAIIDSCHSGTVLDLPFNYNINTGKWDDNGSPLGTYKGTKGGMAICFSACQDDQVAVDTTAFSEENEYTGAMTCTFIKAIKEANINEQKITYHSLLDSMHQSLKQAHKSGGFFSGFRRIFHRRILQDPQLSSSEEFNTRKEFKL